MFLPLCNHPVASHHVFATPFHIILGGTYLGVIHRHLFPSYPAAADQTVDNWAETHTRKQTHNAGSGLDRVGRVWLGFALFRDDWAPWHVGALVCGYLKMI